MKKIFYAAVVASVAFASCTKNEVRTVEDNQDRQITFQAVVQKASTKATSTFANSAAYPTDVPFGTFAYFYTTGFDNTAKTYIDNAEVKHIDGKEANVSSPVEGWTTNPAYYWPKQGYLTFYSYSPYSINGDDPNNPNVTCNISETGNQGIAITKWDVDKNQTVDVMIADRIDNLQNNTSNANNTGWNGVPTVFRHKLAQVVDFKLQTDENYAKIDEGSQNTVGSKQFFVNEIEIYNVKHEARFESGIRPGDGTSGTSIGKWSAWTDSYLSYNWYFNNNNESVNEFTYTGNTCPKTGQSPNLASGDYFNIKDYGYLLVMPQDFTASVLSDTSTQPLGNTPFIKFVYTIRTWWGNQATDSDSFTDEKVTVYQTLAAIHGSTDDDPKGWEINKRYTYTIQVGLNQIYWAPSVENWVDVDGGSVTF